MPHSVRLPRTTSVAAIVAVGILGIGACDSATQEANLLAARDSAGIRIIETSQPVWASNEVWTIDSTPTLEIGSSDDPDQQLDQVGTARWLPDGRIAVGNAGTDQIRFFDSQGRFVKAAGRQGAGPGEFGARSGLSIWLGADQSITASDNANRRVVVFDTAGTHRATIDIAPPARGVGTRVGSVSADGSWIVLGRIPAVEPKSLVAITETVTVNRYQADGRFVRELLALPDQPYFVVGDERFRAFYSLPLRQPPFVAHRGDELLVNRDGAPELLRVDTTGTIREIYRWHPPRRRGTDLIDAYRAAELADAGPDSTWRRRMADFHSMPQPIPAFEPAAIRVTAADDGHLWVQRFYLSNESTRVNDVLAPDGRWLGSVALPPGYWVLEVRGDRMLAWYRDEDDVEHLAVHRIRRPGGGESR